MAKDLQMDWRERHYEIFEILAKFPNCNRLNHQVQSFDSISQYKKTEKRNGNQWLLCSGWVEWICCFSWMFSDMNLFTIQVAIAWVTWLLYDITLHHLKPCVPCVYLFRSTSFSFFLHIRLRICVGWATDSNIDAQTMSNHFIATVDVWAWAIG